MKVVILAGGKGTRISEYTKILPKPMIKVGSKPIIEHIINYYLKFGFNDFIIASGYKHRIIKDYFKKVKISASIEVINTGIETLTGTRLKKLSKKLKKTFMLTYGDGLTNLNLKKLLKFHKKQKKLITLTAVHPPARFGELKIKKNNTIISFEEKPQLGGGWINGGFFILNSKIFKVLNNKNVMLERQPMQKLLIKNELMAYKHEKFWYCMDNLRDIEVLNKIYKSKKIPWKKTK